METPLDDYMNIANTHVLIFIFIFLFVFIIHYIYLYTYISIYTFSTNIFHFLKMKWQAQKASLKEVKYVNQLSGKPSWKGRTA